MFPRFDELEKKRLSLEEKLSDSALIANQREYKKVAQEHSQITKLSSLCNEYYKAQEELAENSEMLHEEDDPELLELVKNDIEELEIRSAALENDIKLLLLPKDPNDEKQ